MKFREGRDTVLVRPSLFVMLMKVVAPFSDRSSILRWSTKGAGVLSSWVSGLSQRAQDLLIGACLSDGPVLVSTGLVVATGDIRKAISVTKQTIMAKSKPLTMAAAA